MSDLFKTVMTGKVWFYETVTSGPMQSHLDTAFDSTLALPSAPGQNYQLRITLRVYFRPIDPAQINANMALGIFGKPIPIPNPTAFYNDFNNTPQIVKAWSATEYANFTNSAKRQAALWDSKFWLVPPNEVGWFDDFGLGGIKIRPNIKCKFKLETTPFAYGAHRMIDVVNLATTAPFRSWDTTYSSDDGKTAGSYSANDQTGAAVNTTQWTVTHEVGHALGLPHINIIRNNPQCGFAAWAANTTGNQWLPLVIPVAPALQGGSSTSICYGPGTTADAINNIMGQGMRFTPEEAQPWLERLPEHLALTGQNAFEFAANRPKWKVVMADTPPLVVH